MKKYPAEDNDPFRDVKDWQDHRYDPGYFTGGNIHPLLKARRPNKYGYVLILSGLGFLFVAFFGLLAIRCIKAVRRFFNVDSDFSMMGASLVACIFGTLLIIATVSNYLSIPYLYFALAGLTAAYLRLSEEIVPSPERLDPSSSLPGAYA